MILHIYAYGNAVLRGKAKEIDKTYPGLSSLISNMYETSENACGVGLAAPQIGESIRLFIIDTTHMTKEHSEYDNSKGFKSAFINPKIISISGKETTYNEGCLSLPGIFHDITRKDEIEVEYYDENFEYKKETFKGFLSRIIQHEYDHLEGILLTDKMPPLKKTTINPKLNKILKGKIETDYPMKFIK